MITDNTNDGDKHNQTDARTRMRLAGTRVNGNDDRHYCFSRAAGAGEMIVNHYGTTRYRYSVVDVPP